MPIVIIGLGGILCVGAIYLRAILILQAYAVQTSYELLSLQWRGWSGHGVYLDTITVRAHIAAWNNARSNTGRFYILLLQIYAANTRALSNLLCYYQDKFARRILIDNHDDNMVQIELTKRKTSDWIFMKQRRMSVFRKGAICWVIINTGQSAALYVNFGKRLYRIFEKYNNPDHGVSV